MLILISSLVQPHPLAFVGEEGAQGVELVGGCGVEPVEGVDEEGFFFSDAVEQGIL